jgi:pimeloyl-ACP methyl ester carboxylesterase
MGSVRVAEQGRFRHSRPVLRWNSTRKVLLEVRAGEVGPEGRRVGRGCPVHPLLCGWQQYLPVVDGVPIHLFHLPSLSRLAVPLILTHGWPGSFFEFEQVMPQLSDPS